DDHLVRLELVDAVAEDGDRIGLEGDAVGGNAFAAQLVERLVEAPTRRRASRVVVDDVALPRLCHGSQHRHANRTLLRARLDRLEQGVAARRLVRDHEQVTLVAGFCAHAWTSCSAGAPVSAPERIACRAPGTPYSYGPPTTCGISSKLKTGGGDETSHSSVIARHGFPGAISPKRQLLTML